MQKLSFQQIILNLQNYWQDYGCAILQPYDLEMGAGTFHPATVFGSLGKKHCNVAYVQPSRRPTDSRYAKHPNRMQHYYQFQVILKPSPDDIQELYLKSLASLGIDFKKHDIRFVEDDWESPTLGASGLGSMLLFIVLGAIGVPVFAGFSSGMSILTGSTAGYIFGCVVCTYFVANMREKYGEDSWLKFAIYGTIGTIVIFIFGLSYLAYFLGSIEGAIIHGLIPFIWPGIAKILFTASTVRLLKNLNARRR